MSYASKEELQNAIGSQTLLDLCDDDLVGDWTTEAADGFSATDRLASCLAQTDRVINGYCMAHYSVPFSAPYPPVVAEIACALAIYYLYRRRRAAFGMPEDVKAEYDTVSKRLVMINSGKLDLGVDPPPAKSSKVAAQYEGPDQNFTSTTLKEF